MLRMSVLISTFITLLAYTQSNHDNIVIYKIIYSVHDSNKFHNLMSWNRCILKWYAIVYVFILQFAGLLDLYL